MGGESGGHNGDQGHGHGGHRHHNGDHDSNKNDNNGGHHSNYIPPAQFNTLIQEQCTLLYCAGDNAHQAVNSAKSAPDLNSNSPT